MWKFFSRLKVVAKKSRICCPEHRKNMFLVCEIRSSHFSSPAVRRFDSLDLITNVKVFSSRKITFKGILQGRLFSILFMICVATFFGTRQTWSCEFVCDHCQRFLCSIVRWFVYASEYYKDYYKTCNTVQTTTHLQALFLIKNEIFFKTTWATSSVHFLSRIKFAQWQ